MSQLTRDQFIAKHKYHLGALALEGAVESDSGGPLSRTQRVWAIPALVEKLLADIYNELVTLPLLEAESKAKPPMPMTPAATRTPASGPAGNPQPQGTRRP